MNPPTSRHHFHSSFTTLISVFFFWGFVAASNGVFIPFCKQYFQLNQLQSQLIDTSFYGAYFYGALVLFVMSYFSQVDILNKMGYKRGIIIGLFISIAGALGLAYTSTIEQATFGMVLLSFFVIALGFSLQQIAAQPFAVALGKPETGAHRLNLAGGINSLGTLLGPLVVSVMLFGNVQGSADAASISSIKILYLFLAGLFTVVAFVFIVSSMPKVTTNETIERSPKALLALLLIGLAFPVALFADAIQEHTGIDKSYLVLAVLLFTLATLFIALRLSVNNPVGWGAMQYPQLVLGMIAIFIYVGVEVTVQSNMGALLKQPLFGGYDESNISHYISLYWGSLMIGRWTGALAVFSWPKRVKQLLSIVVPFVAFALILGGNLLKGNPIDELVMYALCIMVLVVALRLSNEKPARMLMVVSLLATLAMGVGLMTHGQVAIYAFLSGGLFCSVMWPCIFAMAITGLGKYTSQGSAFLIMMILGGALIPPVQGAICDLDLSYPNGLGGFSFTHMSYGIAFFCFAYLAWHALQTTKVLKKQGFDFSHAQSTTH